MLYGCETWVLCDTKLKSVDGAYTRLLRYCMGYTYKDHITNKVLYEGVHKISEVIRWRRLRLIGHCLRADDVNKPNYQMVSKVILLDPDSWDRGGRSRMKAGSHNKVTFMGILINDLRDICKITALRNKDIINLAKHKEAWKKLKDRILSKIDVNSTSRNLK